MRPKRVVILEWRVPQISSRHVCRRWRRSTGVEWIKECWQYPLPVVSYGSPSCVGCVVCGVCRDCGTVSVSGVIGSSLCQSSPVESAHPLTDQQQQQRHTLTPPTTQQSDEGYARYTSGMGVYTLYVYYRPAVRCRFDPIGRISRVSDRKLRPTFETSVAWHAHRTVAATNWTNVHASHSAYTNFVFVYAWLCCVVRSCSS